jgi:small subunit ribosomal protein S20
MPITKSAIKALRQDRRRAAINKPVRSKIKTATDAFKANPVATSLSAAFSAIDRAVKKNLMHKNKAARMKSSLSKQVAK